MFAVNGWEEGTMSETIGGIVRNGVIVPDAPLPEGMRVEITLSTKPISFTPEEQEEFDAWNRASDQTLEAFERMMAKEEGERRTGP
jgi:hypothetical protein